MKKRRDIFRVWVEEFITEHLKRQLALSLNHLTTEDILLYNVLPLLKRSQQQPHRFRVMSEERWRGELVCFVEKHLTYDRLCGPYTEWYLNGRLKYQCNYNLYVVTLHRPEPEVKSHLDGLLRMWSRNGHLTDERPYVDGVLHGMVRVYSQVTGILLREAMYEEGELHGLRREWHSKNILFTSEEYHRGMKHGRCLTYFDDGKLSLSMTYVHGAIQVHDMKVFDRQGNEIHVSQSLHYHRALFPSS